MRSSRDPPTTVAAAAAGAGPRGESRRNHGCEFAPSCRTYGYEFVFWLFPRSAIVGWAGRAAMSSARRMSLLAVALLGASAVVLLAALLSGGSKDTVAPLSEGGAAVRSVRVSAKPNDSVSESPHSLRAWRVRGSLPTGPTMATVRTDEDCAPDELGISRCVNKLRLADGSALVLRHPHDMARVPCMSPGEQIRIIPQ